ncbi:hypothetical protein GCM10023321_50620 [Pseudonocardia eucalypti]|uniref:Uncharacterized protein n=1 Tax=Pseudonocardia eucalypti TaxID=648755 RepID=A0ABP9QKM4_9PSEU
MLLASGLDEAAPLTTAVQVPPVAPGQPPVAWLPRGWSETPGFVASAVRVIPPPQSSPARQVILPPATEAADGPEPRRSAFGVASSPA